jgi:putative SOS response-associated peptidase YedK
VIFMCGRYVLFSDTEMQDIRDIIDEVQRKTNGEIKTGEIFPTDKAPILIQQQGVITPEAVKWGFPGFNNKGVLINARAESAMEKPTFRKSLEAKRCIIPSTGFFEWSHSGPKVKYQFNLPDNGALYMAGLFNDYDGERRFVVLTTDANASMSEIHNRMPVVLGHNEMAQWMDSYPGALDLLQSERPMLIRQHAS